jgi:hypothetical protein
VAPGGIGGKDVKGGGPGGSGGSPGGPGGSGGLWPWSIWVAKIGKAWWFHGISCSYGPTVINSIKIMGLCHDYLNYRCYISTYICWLGHKCVCVCGCVCVFSLKRGMKSMLNSWILVVKSNSEWILSDEIIMFAGELINFADQSNMFIHVPICLMARSWCP